MIYAFHSTNSYKTLERGSERQFLELVSCTKHQFYEKYLWKILPSEKHTLVYVLSGSVQIRDTDKKIYKNHLLLSPRFARLDLEMERGTELIKIVFFASPIVPVLKDGCQSGPLILSGNYPQRNKLCQICNCKKTVVGVKEAILLDFLNDFNKNILVSSTELSLYNRACAWVEAHASCAISAQDVAIAMNCSRAHLNRIFKSIDSECLSDKIVQFRLKRIKDMCRIKSISISEIANKLGFYSTELLCKFFKYHTGISISKYRESLTFNQLHGQQKAKHIQPVGK